MLPECLKHCNAEGTLSEYPRGILRASWDRVKCFPIHELIKQF